MNPKGKKTISLLVPNDYQYGGSEVKAEINSLFQFIWDTHPEILESVPNFSKIKEVLGTW